MKNIKSLFYALMIIAGLYSGFQLAESHAETAEARHSGMQDYLERVLLPCAVGIAGDGGATVALHHYKTLLNITHANITPTLEAVAQIEKIEDRNLQLIGYASAALSCIDGARS